MIEFLSLKREYESISKEIEDAIKRVLNSGRYILGKEVKDFEKEFASYNNAKYCLGTANGMESLQLALMALGIKRGDEIITVANTAAATALSITAIGAKPIFIDIDEESYNIDTTKIENSITKKTKAIIPVHLFGQTADIDPILEIAKKYNLKVIEDTCQAHGALHKNKKAGTLGNIGCFSFYPTKNLGAIGDGGAIVLNDKELHERLEIMRNYGQKTRYKHVIKGLNSRLDEIQAAILKVKLKYLDKNNEKRRKKAKIYNELLEGSDVITPIEKEYGKHVYHLYVIRCEKRDKLMNYLKTREIQTLIHYPIPLHKQEAFSDLCRAQFSLPVTESYAKKIISLPMCPNLKDENISQICKAIKSNL